MSRIGKYPIIIPENVTIHKVNRLIKCKGNKGELNLQCPSEVNVTIEENKVEVKPKSLGKQAKSQWGLVRTLISNMVKGVSQGFSKTLEIRGVGYRAAMNGDNLKLNLGFSHEVVYITPDNIKIQCTDNNKIVINGIDKQKVGQVAAEIRQFRKPEPYKGKGIRYEGEFVIIKEGKKK